MSPHDSLYRTTAYLTRPGGLSYALSSFVGTTSKLRLGFDEFSPCFRGRHNFAFEL